MFKKSMGIAKENDAQRSSSQISLTKEELSGLIKEAVSEALQQVKEQTPRVKLDLQDVAAQLRTPAVNQAFRTWLTWEFRFLEMLAERARRAARDTYDFADTEMKGAVFNADQFAVIESRKADIGQAGKNILDLGVYKGASTRALARIFPSHTIHGFDSFEGLPEDWSHVLKGAFGEVKGALPDMPGNVRLYKGWFDDTLPVWAKQNEGTPITLLRVDCDIYSSTKTIFDVLGGFLESGSWICFDELIGYYGWREHEHKAFMEFIARTGFRYEYVAYGLTYTLVRLL